MAGRSGVDDAIALVERRLVESAGGGLRSLTLRPAVRAEARLADIGAWLRGVVDADRTLALARALMALDRRLWAEQWIDRVPAPPVDDWPDDAWLCIRLAYWPWPLTGGQPVPCDPAILRRLTSGDAAGALQLALRRLRAIGLTPTVRAAAVASGTAGLWAAALAFPLSRHTAERALRRLAPTFVQELPA